ncbi:hypothetical protein KSZ_11300 [Dictyobacter formicarum]|uniref:Uncharacterized protein n=1 Tax=Dictyobacter formicarum TaxID=2778368 RepID=A0ABQ3VBI5_9CHLR|nr:hypothetical protein KSZ_11300 [Dictyobacter formicarum]
MHGLIFVTWERYLVNRFGNSFLTSYRVKIGVLPPSMSKRPPRFYSLVNPRIPI